MADIRYTGAAVAVAQVDRFTPANVEVADIFTLTITGLDGSTCAISFTATAATVANVTAGLTAAWNNSSDALCTPITASDGTTYIELTADTAGDAFSVASTAVDGGGTDTQTLSKANQTANAGPKDWSAADNWSGSAVPGGTGSQDVYVDGATILYGLDQSGIANTLSSLNIGQSQIGSNPATGILAAYLQTKATAVNIGADDGPGTPTEKAPINIDTGSTASTITVYNSTTNVTSTMPAIRLKANSASTSIRVIKGKVGIAYESGETTTVGTININYSTSVNSDASVYIGAGVTVTTINKTGGDCVLRSAVTTVTNSAGTLSTVGTGAITTLNVSGGTVKPSSTGTITTLDVTGGLVDLTRSAAARTITTAKIDPGGSIKYDPSIVTMTNKIQPSTSSGAITLSAA